MSPVERKKIENDAKSAGIQEDEIPAEVDLEMRMLMIETIKNKISHYKEQTGLGMLVIDFLVL